MCFTSDLGVLKDPRRLVRGRELHVWKLEVSRGAPVTALGVLRPASDIRPRWRAGQPAIQGLSEARSLSATIDPPLSSQLGDPRSRSSARLVLIVLTHSDVESQSALPRPTLTVEPDSTVFTGESVTLKCEIVTLDGWTYQWEKQNNQHGWSEVSQTVSHTVNGDTLTISAGAVATVDYYRCSGRLPNRPASVSYSDPVTLTVAAFPRATLTVEPDSIVFTGESVTLKCEIQSNSDWRYQWYKGSSSTAVSQSQLNTYTIRSAADQDQYWCKGKRAGRPTSSQDSDKVTLTVKETPTPTVTITPNPAFRGETVTLSCDLQGGGVKQWTYDWYKDPPVSPSSSSQEYVISSVTHSHSGKYTCSGTVTGTSRYSHTSAPVSLTVSALPRATLTVEPKWISMFTGESVTLKCEIQSYSDWTYQWYKGSSRTAVSQSQLNTYTISSAADQDQYWCRGERAGRPTSSQGSNKVTLTVKVRPTPRLTITHNSAFSGETVTLRCELHGGGVKQWTYSWYKGNSPASPSSSSQDHVISSVTDSHSGDYTCRGTVTGTSRYSHTSAPVTLTVSDLPTATLTTHPTSPLFTGESVTLTCKISNYDEWTYQWEKHYYQHQWFVVSQSVYHTVNGNTLLIRGYYVGKGGQYRCRGKRHDRPGSSQYSNSVTLTVTVRPTPAVTITPNPAFSGETVTLRCDLQGGGQIEMPYIWKKNDSPVSSSSSQDHVISSVTDSHSGDYTCSGTVKGTSRYSETSPAVRLTVSAETPKPELSSGFKGAALRGNSVTLYCKLDQSAGWRFYWSKHSQTPENETTTETHSYTIRSVSVSDGGQYWCRAGRGNPVYYTQYSDALWVNITDNLKALLSIKPDNHVFRGENVTLTCDLHRGGDTEWTYSWNKSSLTVHTSNTTQVYELSVRESDSGKYTCRGERRSDSQRSEISEAVTLTVSAEAQAVLSVSPQSWLTEGDSVTLSCEVRGSSTGWTSSWYRDNNELLSDSRRGSGGSYTLSPAALHHTGVYMCRAERGDPAYHTQYSNAQPLWITATSPPASLIINPSRSQHFTADSLSLSCEGQSNSTGWRVRRYTHSERVSDCSSGWGSVTGSTCNISSLSSSHTGVYWCESESKGSRNPVNITVHSGAVILDSPVHPVTKGDSLTLRCLYHRTKPSNLTADFYKDGSLLQTQTTGEMTIRTVSKSVEGLYHCKLPEKGESPQSWISVRVRPKPELTITPNPAFRGETVTLRCVIGGGVREWTYNWTKDNSPVSPPSSTQEFSISSVTDSHSGDYTCRGTVTGTSRYSETSPAVRLTVSAETPKPELTSSFKGAALIGNPVTLYCKLNQSAGCRFYWSKHTQTPENETTTETHSYTIRSVSVSDGGQYWCRAGRGNPVYYTQYSDALWVHVTASPSVLSVLSSLMAASPYLLLTIMLCVHYYRAHAKSEEVSRTEAVTEGESRL
ncbi:Fc receptor-like protein 5 [Salminus brasiliensis]|uniref:Fc receptor-like protein 5 n=1 Tax=Salminus brasiliensis TaxID=930266 RepID=UPI003B834BFF